MPLPRLLTVAAILSSFALAALAASPAEEAAGARKGVMHLFTFDASVLGGMIKGDIPYDAKTAAAAAGNLAKLSSMDMSLMFPEGSDNSKVEKSHALPAIWAEKDKFLAGFTALNAAAGEMVTASAGGVDAMKPVMGKIGAACGACHKAYRASLN